ncbi:MAG: hypothetical protein ABW007_20725 [Chitinophagaceae bacterium]
MSTVRSARVERKDLEYRQHPGRSLNSERDFANACAPVDGRAARL